MGKGSTAPSSSLPPSPTPYFSPPRPNQNHFDFPDIAVAVAVESDAWHRTATDSWAEEKVENRSLLVEMTMQVWEWGRIGDEIGASGCDFEVCEGIYGGMLVNEIGMR